MKIVVLAGGLSTERDVSLASGAGICRTLRERGHQALLLDVYLGLPYAADKLEEVFSLPNANLEIAEGIKTTEPDLAAIKASREDQSDCFLGPNVVEICRMADIVFMALHGDVGENGKLQATFDLLGIKYTGPNSLGSALAMDKGVTKMIFKMSGVPTPLGTALKKAKKDTSLADLGLKLPVVVKPCSGGSSIGVYIVNTEEEYKDAVEKAFQYEDEVVIEDEETPLANGEEIVIEEEDVPLAAGNGGNVGIAVAAVGGLAVVGTGAAVVANQAGLFGAGAAATSAATSAASAGTAGAGSKGFLAAVAAFFKKLFRK